MSRSRSSISKGGAGNRIADQPANPVHTHSVALVDLCDYVAQQTIHRQDVVKASIVAAFVRSMLQASCKVNLTDLYQLDDAQFERIIAALRYCRSVREELPTYELPGLPTDSSER